MEAFAFGSVPLKTYLPDGDLDISIFTEMVGAEKFKESWAFDLKNFLEAEMLAGEGGGGGQGRNGKGRNGIQIQEVQIIQAEVRVCGVSCGVSCGVVSTAGSDMCTCRWPRALQPRSDALMTQ